MMSFEQVIDIFGDYLALDTEMEVCKSRYGYIWVSFMGQGNYPAIAAAWSAIPQRSFLTFCFPIMKAIWKSSGQRDAGM